MNKIEFRTFIKAPLERCFDLARSVDFHKISFQDIQEKSVAGWCTGLIQENQHVLMSSEIAGIQLSTELKVTKFSPPFYFCYEGSNRLFENIIHDYYFYDLGEQTAMVDHFYYTTNWGFLEDVANVVFLKRYLKNLISKRNEMIRGYAETDRWRDIIQVQNRQEAIVC